MIISAGMLAACGLYHIACTPDAVAGYVVSHRGAPYDQVAWCCAGEHWEREKPHTMLCDNRVHMTIWTQTKNGTDFSKDPWRDGIGAIEMPDGLYCAVWLHRGQIPIS